MIDRMDLLRRRPLWFSFLFAVVVTATAIGLRRWLDMLGEGVAPFALFYPAVLLCTLFGGVGAGILSLVASSIAVTLWWLDPIGSFALSGYGLINLLLFVLTNGIIILAVHLLRSAHFRLRESEARLALSQDIGRIGIWELNLKTGKLWWSPSFSRVTGISPDQPPSVNAFIQRIDPADRDSAVASFDAARRGISKLDIEFRFNRGPGETICLAGRAELIRDRSGNPSRLLGINFDVTPARTIESERDQAHALLQTFFDSLPGAAFVKDAEGRVLLANPGYAAAVGQEPESFLGKTDVEFLRNKEQARIFMDRDQAVLRAGISQQIEEDVVHPNGAVSHWLSVKTPFRNAQGEVQGIVGISLNVTERRRAEQRVRFLADEVDHRAKNLLAVVQSIVRLTRAEDIGTFKAALTGRIHALARTHNLLATSRWEGVDIATLVREELSPFENAERAEIRCSGPSITLDPNASQALTMVLHELAVNAARYGALSRDGGELTVEWQLTEFDGRSTVELVWTEARGPAVVQQVEPGFGSSAIKGAVEHQLCGELVLDWNAAGITCRMAFPVGRDVAQHQPAASLRSPALPGGSSSDVNVDLTGKRVLILDDEPLIATTLQDFVEELGCKVVGPAPSTAAALKLLRERGPDIAILDVNLAGESSAPVANALRALGIPFIYCSGYAWPAEQIAESLQAEMLNKPIDPQELAAALQRASEAAERLDA